MSDEKLMPFSALFV